MTRKSVRVFAPAKINLTLHVTGRRDDGYHLLDSLVAFAPIGDWLRIEEGNTLSLTVEGPEAKGVPADMKNLALKAAGLVTKGRGAAITLEKNLPAASGIGGGSADAAAAWRGLLQLTEGMEFGDDLWSTPETLLRTHVDELLGLGADVPMCFLSQTCRARGVGENLTPVELPPLPAVLANPRIQVSTQKVFKHLDSHEKEPMPEVIPSFGDAAALIDWVSTCRNDLDQSAIHLTPIIGQVLDALWELEGCELARMSGSGATCFGLFPDVEAAKAAVQDLKRAYPDWWISGGLLGNQLSRALPQIS